MNNFLRAFFSLLVPMLLLSPIVPSHDAQAENYHYSQCEKGKLVSFWEQQITGKKLKGKGSVCAYRKGLWSHMNVRGLTPGNAYTVWWVYIDKPDSCANFRLTPSNSEVPFAEPEGYAGRCGLADFFTPSDTGSSLDPLAVFGRMDSIVAGSQRRVWFRGDLRGLEPSPGSQAWMFIFGHGPADTTDKRQLARQLLTPEDPTTGAPHLGIEGRPFGYPAGVVVVDFP